MAIYHSFIIATELNNISFVISAPQPLSPAKTQLSPVRTMTQAEEMRQARNNEAKELIGSRVGTAKAIFTQNSSSGQMHSNKAAPAKPVRNSIAQRINSLNNQQQETTPEESPQIFVLPKTSRVVSTIAEAEVSSEDVKPEVVNETIVPSAEITQDKPIEPASASEEVNVSNVAALPPVKVKSYFNNICQYVLQLIFFNVEIFDCQRTIFGLLYEKPFLEFRKKNLLTHSKNEKTYYKSFFITTLVFGLGKMGPLELVTKYIILAAEVYFMITSSNVLG